jgi:hypothetical protein
MEQERVTVSSVIQVIHRQILAHSTKHINGNFLPSKNLLLIFSLKFKADLLGQLILSTETKRRIDFDILQQSKPRFGAYSFPIFLG